MSTFDRWNKLAGLQNEAAEPQQLAESKQQPESSKQMNESQLREMISKIAKEILSEGLVDMIKMGDDMRSVFDPSTEGWSPTKQMQWGLSLMNYLDPNSDVDGKFGPKTKKAVEKFQMQSNLKPDGVWGPKTNAAFTAAAEAAIADGQDVGLGTVTDPSPDAPLGTVNATKQWLESLLQYSDLDGKVLRMGRSAKKAQPAPEPAAPGENPLNRVLKNLVKRLKSRGEDVDEVDVKAAIMKNMEENPEFSTNIRDLSKDPNPSQSRLMRLVANTVMASLGASDDTAIGGGEAGDTAELTPTEKPALSQDFDRIIDKDEGEFGALGL